MSDSQGQLNSSDGNNDPNTDEEIFEISSESEDPDKEVFEISDDSDDESNSEVSDEEMEDSSSKVTQIHLQHKH